MDIMSKIEEIVDKVKSDKDFASKFSSDPKKAVESIIGIDLPNDQVEKVIEGVKAKVSIDNAGGIVDSIKKLF